jgi:hypothetical protein
VAVVDFLSPECLEKRLERCGDRVFRVVDKILDVSVILAHSNLRAREKLTNHECQPATIPKTPGKVLFNKGNSFVFTELSANHVASEHADRSNSHKDANNNSFEFHRVEEDHPRRQQRCCSSLLS